MRNLTNIKNLKLSIGDLVRTEQDHWKEYTGKVIDITMKPHPFRSSDKLIKFYRIEYGFRKGSFETCCTSMLSK